MTVPKWGRAQLPNGRLLFQCKGPCPMPASQRQIKTSDDAEAMGWWQHHLVTMHATGPRDTAWESVFWDVACGEMDKDTGLRCIRHSRHDRRHVAQSTRDDGRELTVKWAVS